MTIFIQRENADDDKFGRRITVRVENQDESEHSIAIMADLDIAFARALDVHGAIWKNFDDEEPEEVPHV